MPARFEPQGRSAQSLGTRALAQSLRGKSDFNEAALLLYPTDASAYQELPLRVAFPADDNDLATLIRFAVEHGTSLIPRTAGTALHPIDILHVALRSSSQ